MGIKDSHINEEILTIDRVGFICRVVDDLIMTPMFGAI